MKRISTVQRDLWLVLIASVLTWIVAGSLDLAERWINWAALGEHFQLDEIIFVLLVACIGLVWFGRRRYLELSLASNKNRQITESLEKRHQEIADLLLQNRALVKHITGLREDERNQLAIELHDVFGQYLAAIDVTASVGLKLTEPDTRLKQILQTIHNSTTFLREVTRSKLRSIKPPGLEAVGVSAAVKDLLLHWRTTLADHEIKAQIAVLDHLVTYDVGLTIYRCMQEAVVNITRHAKATHVTISLNTQFWRDTTTRCVQLIIEDNGQGFEPALNMGNGLGLIGMRERVLALSGEFEITSSEHVGSKIALNVPLHHPVAEPALTDKERNNEY